MKFGGSSLANNERLEIVANKILEYYGKYNIVVILSAQGKTTDKLINEAYEMEINNKRINRELDTLISTGEQISIAKLSIYLNNKGYESISLTGWQAGIKTDDKYQNASIINIDTKRIKDEINNNKIVIVAGFQGINKYGDITTLGRGGSDYTAVALASYLNAKRCYIFSDVDGIYSADPNKVKNTIKFKKISYNEMLELANVGAKVLQNKCIKIGKDKSIPIVAKGTFKDNLGTIISDKTDKSILKSMVIKDNVIYLIGNDFENNKEIVDKIKNSLNELKITIKNFEINKYKLTIYTNKNITNEIEQKIHDTIFLK